MPAATQVASRLLVENMRSAAEDSRPAGARPVRVTLDLFPWFGPEETP